MSRHGTVKWVALALVGLLIAGAVAVAGSRLASRQIGLASEPIRAGDALAPPAGGAVGEQAQPATPGSQREPETRPSEATTPSVPPASPESTTPSGSTEPSGSTTEPSHGSEPGEHGSDGDSDDD